MQTRLAESTRPRPTRTPTPEQQALAPTEPPATPTPAPTPPPISTPTPDPADEVLLLALLSEADFAEGWWGDEAYIYEDGVGTLGGDDEMLRSPGDSASCGSDVDDPYLNQVANLYGDDASDQLVMQFVALYENEQSADLYLSQLVALMQLCPEYEETIDGQLETVRISQLEFPAMGDRSAAFKMVSTGIDYQVESVIVGFRVGRTVTVILHTAESNVAGPAEAWGTQEISLRAFEKLMSLKEQLDALERPAPNVV